ncbi:MAG: tryptophan 7-halogenase [Pseudomonadales bacterium]
MNGVLNRVDVCILGGGLAGQTLARQLRQRAPSLDIVVLEHRRHPFPEGAHKVGESTVEIASAYLAGTLGLEAHLREAHLPKFGLRMFLRGETPISDDLACYDEIGVSRVLPIPTYQIDRGRLENHLTMLNRQAGVSVLDGTTIRSVSTSVRTHLVTLRSDAGESTIQARYLVDATGRRAFLRSQTGLSRAVRHRNHAIWLRVEGALDIDRWSNDAQWAARCHGKSRRLSTNHFTGPGYWVWLIPLASGCTSVGLVFDPTLVDLDEVNSHAGLLDWLRREHPLVAAALENRSVLDFHVLKSYAVGSRQLFHEDGWMLTGDAGVFSDPFYSPGSDFIAFANGFITELIASAADAETYAAFQRYFLSFFANTLSIYRGQYGGFGDRDLMALKTVWDYAYYWGALAKLFFCKGYADGAFMAEAHPELLRASVLNTRMQRLFRDMSRRQRRCGGEGGFFDHHEIGSFHTLKQQLLQEDSHGAATGLRTVVNYLGDMAALLETVAGELAGGARLPAASRFGQVPLVV